MGKLISITNSEYEKHIETIVDALKKEQIIIMPSDTIYGFLCTASCEDRVRTIKQRDTKPFLYLIDSYSRLDSLSIAYKEYGETLEKNWPGPFTFILENTEGTTIGTRMPDWELLRKIASEVDQPLLSTSVNISGQPALNDPEEIVRTFLDQVDLIITDEHYSGDTSSTIIKLDKTGHTLIRQGSGEFRC